MIEKNGIALLCFGWLLFLCPSSASAQSQTTGRIAGTVRDQRGALIVGANVTVSSKTTAGERQVTTDNAGNFSVPFLPPGTDSSPFAAYAGAGDVLQLTAGRNDPMPFKFTLNAGIVGSSQPKIVVALRMLDARRPMDIGHSIDHRLLGLFVKSVSIDGVLVFTPAGAGP